MKKILSIACIIAAAVTFSSCKDFLDVKPSNQGDSSTSISSASDAEVMINGLMSKMSSSSYYGRDFLLYGDAKGGDVTIFTAGFGGNDLYYFSHSQTGSARSGYWSQIYNCILQANNIITNIYALQEAGSTEDFEALNLVFGYNQWHVDNSIANVSLAIIKTEVGKVYVIVNKKL